MNARLALAVALLVAMLADAAIAQPAPAASAARRAAAAASSNAFDEGKALGRANATTSDAGIKNGTAQQTVDRAVPTSATPQEASSYSSQNGAATGAQRKADCRNSPDDPTCSAVNIGSQQRDTSGTPVNSSATNAQAAISHPDQVLGDIAQTYQACSVGGQMTSAPSWSVSSCTVGSSSWSDHTCTKTLNVRPILTVTCTEGAVIAGTGGYAAGDDGGWSLNVKGWCSLPTGGVPMRFTVEGDLMDCADPTATVKPLIYDLDLYTLPSPNVTVPKELPPVFVRKGDTCKPVRAFVYGPGCDNADHCQAGLYFTPDQYKTKIRCESGLNGAAISFGGFPPEEQASLMCFFGYPSQAVIELIFGKGIVGYPGVVRGATTTQYWLPFGKSVFDHVEWPENTIGGPMTFPLPHARPPKGDTWSNGCAGLEALTPNLPPDGSGAASLPIMPMLAPSARQRCTLRSSTCVDGLSARTIDGVAVSRACWTYRNVFSCTTSTPASHCAAAGDPSCSQASSTSCLNQDRSGHCLQARFDYACRTSTGTLSPAVNCGDQSSFCSGGSCWDSSDTQSQANQNYAVAMGQFQARAEAAKDKTIEPLKVHIFKGTGLQCRRSNFGLDNCCADSGVTQQCTAEEKQLYTLKQAGKCVQAGEYCSHHTLFGCSEHKRTYCCFNSVLGRIVQEGGRQQLGKDWGDSKKPDCSGLTPDELARIDWSQLDLRDYFATLHLDPKPQDPQAVTQRVEGQQTSCYYGDGKC